MRYVKLTQDNKVLNVISQFDPKFPGVVPQKRYTQEFLDSCILISDDTLEILSGMIYSNGRFAFEELPKAKVVEIPEIEEPEAVTNEDILNDLKSRKKEEFKKIKDSTIYAGCDVNTSQGKEHFSLTPEDQSDIKALYDEVSKNPSISLLYHSEGTICRFFSAEEITNLYMSAMQYKTYHTTYENHLCAWVDRVKSVDELNLIRYGSALPDDLQTHLENLLEEYQKQLSGEIPQEVSEE